MTFKYSIIIPHYNDSIRLHKLIESIPLRDEIEILVIDDNSEWPLDLSSFSNYNISIMINDTGVQSAGACRNIGLKKATGHWLLFADADDYFIEGAFDIIDSKMDGNIDIFYFSPKSECLITGGDSDRHIGFVKLVDDFLNNDDDSIRFRCIVPWSKVYRRSFIVNNKLLFEEVIASNDLMFSLTSGHIANEIKVFKDSIYCVTKGVNTLTTNYSKEVMVSRFLVELKRFRYIKKYNINYPKSSVLHFIKIYKACMSFNSLKLLFSSYKQGYINFFPETYFIYLTSPKVFYRRFFRIKTSCSHKKYYYD